MGTSALWPAGIVVRQAGLLNAAPAVERPTLELAANVRQPGAQPDRLTIAAGDFLQRIRGMLRATTWDATFPKGAKETDPRDRSDDWRQRAAGPGAVRAALPQLMPRLGYRSSSWRRRGSACSPGLPRPAGTRPNRGTRRQSSAP